MPSRLELAKSLGAEVINFEEEDPLEVLKELTGGIGVDRAIDAVGVDAVHPHRGPAAKDVGKRRAEYQREVKQVAPDANPQGDLWVPGDAPSQVLEWAVEALAKAGTLAIIGVYPTSARTFPIGTAVNMNLTIQMGNCPHRRYIPQLLELVEGGTVQPSKVLTQIEPLTDAIEAFEAFDRRETGWIKVGLAPAA